MKNLSYLLVTIGAFASPVVSFAQSTEPLTRAQVRAELIRLEEAGYHAGTGDDTTYPAGIQAAESKIAAQDSQQTASNSAPDRPQAANNALGGTTLNGTSAASWRFSQTMSERTAVKRPKEDIRRCDAP